MGNMKDNMKNYAKSQKLVENDHTPQYEEVHKVFEFCQTQVLQHLVITKVLYSIHCI